VSIESSRGACVAASRRRRGFTLIELLFVVLVVAVLASIAVVKLNSSKRRAYISVMKADLRNLASSAEARFAMDGNYSNVVVSQSSQGVSMTMTVGVTDWSAVATHANAPGVSCTLSVGGPAELTGPNEPVCQ